MVAGMMTEGRGFSNAKAERELGWGLRYPSWRQGFKEEQLRPLLFPRDFCEDVVPHQAYDSDALQA
jgi:hypothetical protein